MGTRADFYIGRGEDAEWLGSTAWDGYFDGIDNGKVMFACTTPDDFREAVAEYFNGREDATLPEQGWPWPWDTSHTTDYSYAIDDGKVYASCFGGDWFDPLKGHDDEDDNDAKSAVFPNMSARKNVTMGKRSGIILIQS